MNFKTLLQIINEDSRERNDSFRTTGEAVAKEKATANAGDNKAKDAARKREERSRQIPRDRKSKAELLKDIVIVKTKSGRVQIIFKDSFNKEQHEDLTKSGSITFEEAKKIAGDPNFEQTRASKLLLGNMKEKPKEEKKEKAEEQEEKPRRLSKKEMFGAMNQMSAEQLAMMPPEAREEYFKSQRNPPTNKEYDNNTFEALSIQFGISPISSLPFNQQVLNAILFLSKIKVGAGQQEMQTFATMNPASTDFTKRAYLQANKILSQIGDQCLSNLISATESGNKQMYSEGSVDMKCGDYRFKIEAGGEFSVSTDKLNQSNKLFKGILANSINSALNDPKIMESDPGVKKMLANISQSKSKVSNILISNEALPIILQNEKYVQQLQNTPVILGDGTESGTILDAEGNLNPAASLENLNNIVQKASKSIFKKDMDTGKSAVGNYIASSILRSYLRGDGLKSEKEQPNHVVTGNGVFALSDDYIQEISKNAVLNAKPSETPLDGDNISNFKPKSVEQLKKWRSIVEEKQEKKDKTPSLKELMIDINTINPMEIASNYLQANMDFDFDASLIPGFKPDDLNAVEYNYVRIGNKVTKIPVTRSDKLSNQLLGETYLFLNSMLVESLSNNFVLSSLVKVNLLTSYEADILEQATMLTESDTNPLKEMLDKVIKRATAVPFKISLLEQILEEYKRDYKMEYRNYHGKPKQKKERAARTRARELMIKKGRAKRGDGKDIDHKKPLRSGGSNSINNLRKRGKSDNRSDNGHHKGEKQSKDWK
jgi:hypothetical protein